MINLKGKQGCSFRGRDETSVQLPMRHGRGGDGLTTCHRSTEGRGGWTWEVFTADVNSDLVLEYDS